LTRHPNLPPLSRVVFSSIPFLFFFLPIFLAVYFVTPSIRGKNLVTLLSSLLFYGWGEPWFVLVLLASIAFNTFAAVVIDRCRGSARGIALGVAVVANLLLLATFKYANFLAANLDVLLRPLGTAVNLPDIPLPLGISFFTFHKSGAIHCPELRRVPVSSSSVWRRRS
jgi:alginate O-acetyltransferase complex protein AlgI